MFLFERGQKKKKKKISRLCYFTEMAKEDYYKKNQEISCLPSCDSTFQWDQKINESHDQEPADVEDVAELLKARQLRKEKDREKDHREKEKKAAAQPGRRKGPSVYDYLPVRSTTTTVKRYLSCMGCHRRGRKSRRYHVSSGEWQLCKDCAKFKREL